MFKHIMRMFSVMVVIVIFTNQSFSFTSARNSLTENFTSDIAVFDEAEIYNAFSEINDLQNYLSENETVTYSDLQKDNTSLLTLVNDNSAIAFTQEEKFTFNKQTAFLMGCVFGVLGIAAVAIINNGDQERLNSSIWGCVASGCLAGLPSLVFIFYYFYSSVWYYSYL